RDSAGMLVGLVEREHERGIPYEKILLAGFSQGGAIASHAAFRFPHRLAGLMALSTYLPLHSCFAAEVVDSANSQSRDLPIFMAHGSFDPVVPMALGKNSQALVARASYEVEWHDYPMAHAVCGEEIADIRRWLLSVYQSA
ncbi:MAG: carboxylesterase, partial [Gammaproteobacteria bacterium]|nr:carboxylesterase [Gammaproteobacteria bacterium]